MKKIITTICIVLLWNLITLCDTTKVNSKLTIHDSLITKSCQKNTLTLSLNDSVTVRLNKLLDNLIFSTQKPKDEKSFFEKFVDIMEKIIGMLVGIVGAYIGYKGLDRIGFWENNKKLFSFIFFIVFGLILIIFFTGVISSIVYILFALIFLILFTILVFTFVFKTLTEFGPTRQIIYKFLDNNLGNMK